MNALMLRRLFLFLSLFGGLAFAMPAHACECSTTEVDPQAYLRAATLVFEGEVLSRPLTSWINNTAMFRVLVPLKGRLGDEVTLDQDRTGNCAAVFAAGERVRIVARGNAADGYWTSACMLAYLHPEFQGNEIWSLAAANRQRTVSLGGADLSVADAPTLRRLIRWHADYESFEEGLDALERLLDLVPGDAEALQFKARFLSSMRK